MVKIITIESMLQGDLDASVNVDLSEYDKKPFWFKLVVRIARLLTPLL